MNVPGMARRDECALHVGQSFLGRQRSLRRGMPGALQCANDGQTYVVGEVVSLVEATFAATSWMQRNRYCGLARHEQF